MRQGPYVRPTIKFQNLVMYKKQKRKISEKKIHFGGNFGIPKIIFLILERPTIYECNKRKLN